MSLKSFHIVFVTFTFLLSAFFTAWAFGFAEERSAFVPFIGWCGVAGLLLSPLYGVYFWKKAAKIYL
ncbi:MAG: hypothetical protein KGQ89_07445 [Verrucomicrobia bacterium]|nr:hypothetical protein [Verrucomicrobiota bacterium]